MPYAIGPGHHRVHYREFGSRNHPTLVLIQGLMLDGRFWFELPELPERYQNHPELLEQVHECQSPLFLAVEVEEADGEVAPADRPVRLYFQAPAEAPTTRGFASILHAGLDGLSVDEVLAVPDDAPFRFGLGEAVSPLRLRGMAAMLARIKRRLRSMTPT